MAECPSGSLGRLSFLTLALVEWGPCSGSLRSCFPADPQLGPPLAPPGHSPILQGAVCISGRATLVESLSCLLRGDLPLPCLSLSTAGKVLDFKDRCDWIGPTQMVQRELPILNLSHRSEAAYSQVEGLAHGHLWGWHQFAYHRNRQMAAHGGQRVVARRPGGGQHNIPGEGVPWPRVVGWWQGKVIRFCL